MKCEIIRDLFPSYIDGLTSKESNEAVEEHLEKCKECRDYLEAMKKEIVSAKYVERRKEEIKKDVEPLRKLKRVTKQMVAGTVLFCIVAIGIALGAYEGYYGTGVQPNSEDVKITCEKIDSVVRIGFQPQKEGVYLEAMVKEENEKPHITPVSYTHLATIVGALIIGVSREIAAEFTFFLAIPVMFGASLLKLIKFGFAFTAGEFGYLMLGCVVSFAVSIFAIKFLMSYIKKNDFKVFGYYRIVLGGLIVVVSLVQMVLA